MEQAQIMDELSLRVGRLEDKFSLYEPILSTLPGLATIPTELSNINQDLRELKDSKIEARERLTTLFKTQTKGHDEVIQRLEEKTKMQEKEIADCPINDIISRVILAEKEILVVKSLDPRLKTLEKAFESFKLKGWDLLFRIAPWVFAGCATLWAVLKSQ